MRLFVKYSPDGTVINVVKVEILPVECTHPYGEIAADENVLEVTITPELEQLDGVQLYSDYRVNPKSQQLVKKT